MSRRSTHRDLWTRYVIAGAKPRPGPGRPAQAIPRAPIGTHMRARFQGRVIGIDPSLRGTGLAVLRVDGERLALDYSETVRVPASRTLAECLCAIATRVDALFENHAVDAVALEQPIVVQSARSALALGSARGAAVAAAAIRGFAVAEFPPLRIKQAITGQGRASKAQVIRTIQALLGVAALSSDEADAAATALCFAWTYTGGDAPTRRS